MIGRTPCTMNMANGDTVRLAVTARPRGLPGDSIACLAMSTIIANLKNGSYNRNNPLIRSHTFNTPAHVTFVVHPTSTGNNTSITATNSGPLLVARRGGNSVTVRDNVRKTAIVCGVNAKHETGTVGCARPVPFHSNNVVATCCGRGPRLGIAVAFTGVRGVGARIVFADDRRSNRNGTHRLISGSTGAV